MMFGKRDENWEQFRELTGLMEKTGQKQVPEQFTSKIMEKLPEKEIVPSFYFTRLFPTNLDFSFSNSVTKKECAFYFLLTGFFYFIFGFIMILGLPLPAVMQNNSWLSFQPVFGLLLAAELTILGIVFYKMGDSAIYVVRIGTLLYAALIILNFGIGTFYIQSVAGIFFIAVFSLAGLVLAILLRIAIDHYSPETFFSEVNR